MAVYTTLDEATLRHHVAAYDIGELEAFAGIADGVENTNYCLKTLKGKYILTLFEKRVSLDDLPFYLGFMRHLAAKGVPCPDVVPSCDGRDVVPLAGKLSVVTTFLQGGWPKSPNVAQCAAVGETLANMHLAAADFTLRRANTMALPQWRALIEASLPAAEKLETGLGSFLQEELAFLNAYDSFVLPKGAVHADLFPDNVFFQGDDLSGVIDFYFACTDYFVYDLMLTLNPWCFDAQGGLDKDKSAAFLAGYQRVRPLSDAEKSALPFFGRAAAVRIVATRLYDGAHPKEGATVTPKNPMEHVRILRFHQQAKSMADYLP